MPQISLPYRQRLFNRRPQTWRVKPNIKSGQFFGLYHWFPLLPPIPHGIGYIVNENLVTVNSPDFISDDTFGMVMDFESGSSEYFTRSGQLPVIPDFPLSFTGWVYFTGGAGGRAVLDLSLDDTGNTYFRAQRFPNDTFRFQTRNTSVSTYNAGDLGDNVWIHFAYVVASETSHVVYINGQLDGSESTSVPFVPYTRISIGNAFEDNASEDAFLQGRVFDIRVYNRELLQSDVDEIYNERTRWNLYEDARNKIDFIYGEEAAEAFDAATFPHLPTERVYPWKPKVVAY